MTIEEHADAILKAAGSSLRNYTMPGNREAILAAVRAVYEDGAFSVTADRATIAAMPAPNAAKDAEITALKNALSECAAQFAFYGIEHRKAGKIEKAETNERFFNIANNAIERGEHSAKGE